MGGAGTLHRARLRGRLFRDLGTRLRSWGPTHLCCTAVFLLFPLSLDSSQRTAKLDNEWQHLAAEPNPRQHVEKEHQYSLAAR